MAKGITYSDVRSREDAKDYLFSARIINRTRQLYIDRNLSVRQTIEEMALSEWYENNKGYFARAFSYYLPKGGKNQGGARPGSGRPPGSRTCTGCGELRKDCTCPQPVPSQIGNQILGVLSRPSGRGDGVYTAAVVVQEGPVVYAYQKEVNRYPTHADVQRTIHAGEKIPPSETQKIFADFLDHRQTE